MSQRLLSRPPWWRLALLGALLVTAILAAPWLRRENLFAKGGRVDDGPMLADFPREARSADRWLGTAPLTAKRMRGKVWVLEFWTFGCINCVRSIPYANHLVKAYGDRIGVLGIHSPEFEWERDVDALRAAKKEHGVSYPTYIDDDRVYFERMKVRGWPTFLVVDERGRVRGSWFGEVHEDTRRAAALEALIDDLLIEAKN